MSIDDGSTGTDAKQTIEHEPAQWIETFKPYRYKLYLGALAAVYDSDFLKAHNIQCVMTVADYILLPSPMPSEVRHHIVIPICDWTTDIDLRPFLTRTRPWIRIALSEHGNTLVHCLAGVKRSATVVADFLLEDVVDEKGESRTGNNLEMVIGRIRKVRPRIAIPGTFRAQLLKVIPPPTTDTSEFKELIVLVSLCILLWCLGHNLFGHSASSSLMK